jgi:thermosome
MALYGIPIVLKGDTKTEKGYQALIENISAVKTISELIKSTLGPKGSSKMIVDSLGEGTVTNDCFTILDGIQVEHPAAKMAIQLSKTMNKNVGDGVAKSIIIAGELLSIGQELLEQKFHPNIVVNGFKKALNQTLKIIIDRSLIFDVNNENKLKLIAQTALNSKNTYGAKEILTNIVTEAAIKIMDKRGTKTIVDTDLIQIIKKEGEQLKSTMIVDGVIVDKEVVGDTMPKNILNAKIALIDHSLEITKTEFDTDIKIIDPLQLKEFKNQEELMIRTMVDQIVKTGATVVFCQKGIDDLAQHFLAQKNIMAIRRVKRSDLTKLMKATHGNIVTDLKSISEKDLGHSEKVEELQIGKDKMIFVTHCKDPKSISILIRGGTKQIIDDGERSIKNALNTLKNVIEFPFYVAGAGSIEIEIAKQLKKYAKTINTRESIAVEAYAAALEIIPEVLAENSGFDPIQAITALQAKHEEGKGSCFGFDIDNNTIIDADKKGIIEPSGIITQVISSATELSIMLLHIDETISVGKASTGPKMPNPKESDLED